MTETLPGFPPSAAAEGTDLASAFDSVEHLYLAHADSVHRIIERLGGSSVDADDLTHEVFLVALRKWASLPAHTNARAWLHQVAAREVAAALRKARWRRRLGLAHTATETAWQPTDVERHDARAAVLRLLDGMSEKKRVVFLLFEVDGLTGQEIANIVGAPLMTVWTRLFHARREFLEALEREQRRER